MVVFLTHLYGTVSRQSYPPPKQALSFLTCCSCTILGRNGIYSKRGNLEQWSLNFFDHELLSIKQVWSGTPRVKRHHNVKSRIPNFHFCKVSCILKLMEWWMGQQGKLAGSSGLQLRSPDRPGSDDCSLPSLLAIFPTSLRIDGGDCVSCGWLGLKNFCPLCLMCVGTGDRSLSPNSYC